MGSNTGVFALRPSPRTISLVEDWLSEGTAGLTSNRGQGGPREDKTEVNRDIGSARRGNQVQSLNGDLQVWGVKVRKKLVCSIHVEYPMAG